jgi:Na+/H+ antiporter NhaC
MSESKPGVSFAFSSKRKHENVKLTQSKLLDTTQETREETDFVKTVEHNKINGFVTFPASDIHLAIIFYMFLLFQVHQESSQKGIDHSSYNKESVEDSW